MEVLWEDDDGLTEHLASEVNPKVDECHARSKSWSKLVGRPELGTKCACASCAERFYDLNRSPAVCPKCGATQPPVVARVPRPVRVKFGSPYMTRRAEPVAAEEEISPAVETDEDEDDEDSDGAVEVPEIDADSDADVEHVTVPD
jgi:uncharacterized protein (TIGR02300 family)